jgi:hypothetical protein
LWALKSKNDATYGPLQFPSLTPLGEDKGVGDHEVEASMHGGDKPMAM